MINAALCVAEDAWSWIALLCGDHLGHLFAFYGDWRVGTRAPL